MAVKVYCINEGTSSQYFGIMTHEGNVLMCAPNNWKTCKGAERWARKNGFIVLEVIK